MRWAIRPCSVVRSRGFRGHCRLADTRRPEHHTGDYRRRDCPVKSPHWSTIHARQAARRHAWPEWRNFLRPGQISAPSHQPTPDSKAPKRRKTEDRPAARRSGPALANIPCEPSVFRATVLSIVLVFAASPSASVFCEAWCAPDPAAESHCHHENTGSSASVGGNDSCQDAVPGAAVLVREDIRRGSTSAGRCGSAIPRFQMTAPAWCARPATDLSRALTDTARPLSTPLRI